MVKKISSGQDTQGEGVIVLRSRAPTVQVVERSSQTTVTSESPIEGALKFAPTSGMLKRINYDFDKV